MKCLAVLIVISSIFVVSAGNAKAYERVFSYEPETEYVGAGVEDANGVTPEQCRDRCKQNGRCGYYTWYPPGAPSKSTRYSGVANHTRCILMMGPFKRYTKRAAISGMIQEKPY
jgi:hypothetical protein